MQTDAMKKMLEDIVEDNSRVGATAPDLLKYILDADTEFVGYRKRIEELEAANKDLSDANVKLFLSVTGKAEEEEEEPEKSLMDISKEM